jgi:HD-GYP domain-containing protein (c-di-GMP phosphodiesterase class II)
MSRPIRVALIMILALFDLDGFKSYNEQLRPRRRDALLQRLASALRAVLAVPASVYRMGGDEFCALLPGGDQGVLLRAGLRGAHRSNHLDDVVRLVEEVACELGCGPALVERVRIATELHDIGKMAIPESILSKPRVLSEGERALMRQHTVAGERIIASSPALADVARWCALRSSAGTAPAIPTSSAASRFRGPRGSSRSATPITR